MSVPPRLHRSADNTVHDLIALSNDVRRHADRVLAERGYTDVRPSFAVLLSLVWRKGVPQSRLVDALGVSAQAASQTIGLAEEAGYVARSPNPHDRRSKIVVMTPHGRRLVEHGASAVEESADRYAEVVGNRRFAHFVEALAALREGLGITDTAEPVASLTPRSSLIVVSILAAHAMAELSGLMRASGHVDITGTQNLVLVYIGPDGARPAELARAQQVSRQAISATLGELEATGHVVRRPDPGDARGVLFCPTERGRATLDTYVAGLDELERRYAQVLGPEGFAELLRTAFDLNLWIGVEQRLPGLARTADGTGPSAGPRPLAELGALATDLNRLLGPADALRLSGLLAQTATGRRGAITS